MTRTQCIAEQMEFQGLGSRRVIATSNGGAITSDAGGLLLRDTEGRVKLIAGFAACFEDGRDARRVEHELGALLRQRVYALALGYEDVNDHERLRFDPMLQILSGKLEATRRKGDCESIGLHSLRNRLAYACSRLADDRTLSSTRGVTTPQNRERIASAADQFGVAVESSRNRRQVHTPIVPNRCFCRQCSVNAASPSTRITRLKL